MFARLFEQCVAEMGVAVPGAYKSGFGKPLHAHVCYTNDGGEGNESQKG